MGLATIDPHRQKEHTDIHKIPKFGVRLVLTEIQLKKSKLTKKCMASGRYAHSGQTQKSKATSGFRRLELRKSLKRKPARLL